MATNMINNPEKIREIINKCDTCYVGMTDTEGKPYVLPFNFGYEEHVIYLHMAGEGKKIGILQHQPDVCVAFSTDHQLFHRNEGVACSYGMHYRSVLAYGRATFVDDYDEKVRIMNVTMRKYTGKDFSYNTPAINNVCICRIDIDKIEGKLSGYF
ncbi:MAG: pyridoxamine 5'-phosphate oxidase family protein [Bacteroidales bacterium]